MAEEKSYAATVSSIIILLMLIAGLLVVFSEGLKKRSAEEKSLKPYAAPAAEISPMDALKTLYDSVVR